MKTLHLTIIITLGSIATGMIVFVLNSDLNTSYSHLSLQNNNTENNSSSINLEKNNQSRINANNDSTYSHDETPIDNTAPFRYSQATTTLWNYVTDGPVHSVAISSDDKYVVAGSESTQNSGTVYFLDNQGSLLWQHTTDRKIGQVFISSDGSHVLASGYQIAPGPAGIYENGAIYFFDKDGTMLWNYITNDYGQILVSSLSSDGSHVVIASGTKLSYLDDRGKTLWNYTSHSEINSVSISSDGSNILTSAGHTIQYFDKGGKLLWTFDTDYDYAYVKLSPDGKYVVAGDAPSGYDGKIYFIDNHGNLIKKDQIGSPILSLSISDDNSHVAIGTNWATMVFNSAGNQIWNDKISSQVAISSNGSFVAAVSGASNDVYLTYFDSDGNILSRYAIGDWAQITLSKDSQYVALGHSTNYAASIQFIKVPSYYAAGLGVSDIPQFNLKNMQTSNDAHVMISSTNNTELYAQVATGQTVQLPYNLNFETNFTSNDLQLGINSSSYIDASISPVFPTEIINDIYPGNKIITIRADPHAIPGNYTLVINGTGSTDDFNTGWVAALDNVILAKVHVTVKPSSSQISINVGQTHYETKSFCINLAPGGQSCGSGPIYEEVPITVYSNFTQTVDLGTLGLLEKGEWVKFVPDKLVTGPHGATAKMLISGYEVPVIPNPLSDTSLVVQATSGNDTQTVTIPVIPLNLISVLHSSSPIKLRTINTNSDGANFAESGVVYDPLDKNKTLPVKLAVLDFLDGNLPISLPLWLSVDIPNPEFTLNATQPYYFIITVNTHDAPPSGTYTIEIDEDIGGQHFVQPEEIVIENIRHG